MKNFCIAVCEVACALGTFLYAFGALLCQPDARDMTGRGGTL